MSCSCERNLLAVHPGVVVGEVQPPELADRPLDQSLHVGGLAHVGLLEHGPAPGLPDQCHDLLALGGVPVADHQSGPGLRHRQGRRLADARPAARHDPDLALQVSHRRSLLANNIL